MGMAPGNGSNGIDAMKGDYMYLGGQLIGMTVTQTTTRKRATMWMRCFNEPHCAVAIPLLLRWGSGGDGKFDIGRVVLS